MSAETGGSGDDLHLLLRNDATVEVQVKRGLTAGDRLWEPLLALSAALHAGSIGYGLLAVSPNSSGTIKDRLARDIVRIGEGRDDHFDALGSTFLKKLEAAGIPASVVCGRLRIVTVHALSTDGASVAAARAELAHLCREEDSVGDAWNRLYRDATQLIEMRGRRTAPTVLAVLQGAGIALAPSPQAGPVALLPKLTQWTAETAAHFSILGATRSLPVDSSWIPLKIGVLDDEAHEGLGLVEALDRYHKWASRDRRDRDAFDGETIGRFVRHAVVVAGPGMGKSVLLKKLARGYSADGHPVLLVSLVSIATRMRTMGSSFVESLFELGLGGFEVPAPDVIRASLPDWVLLCDGLDECGADQEKVAQGILDYVAGHPHCRTVVTTRPVGYRSTVLRAWRHYEIVPLETSGARGHLGDLIADIVPDADALTTPAYEIASAALKSSNAESVIARSPLLLGMSAVILARGKTLGRSKAELYARLFDLIDQAPNTRHPVAPATPAVLHRFLNIFGWQRVATPTAQTAALTASCAEALAAELQLPRLKAQELTENCIAYWQAAGAIERVYHSNQETLTFIHKTFGEFAAARFLAEAEEAEQRRMVAAILPQDSWVEVLNFAGSLGVADLVASLWLGHAAETSAGVEFVVRALMLAAEAEPPPNAGIRKQLIEVAFRFASKDRQRWAYDIGDALVSVAERFPDEVGPFAAELLDAEHVWTRVVAWTCAAIVGAKFYPLDGLIRQLEAAPATAEYGLGSSLGVGLTLRSGNIGLLQRFIVAAVGVVLEACSTEVIDRVLPPIINNLNLQSWQTNTEIRELLTRKGKAEMIQKPTLENRFATMLSGSKEYNTAQRIAYQKMLGCLIKLDPSLSGSAPAEGSAKLLHISAFLYSTKFLDSPLRDMWGWSRPYDVAAVQEVFRGVVGMMPIERARILSDAHAMLRRLEQISDDDMFKIWGVIASVDVPDFEETKAKELNLNFDLLEIALYHRSTWVLRLALFLYINAADAPRMKEAVGRLLANGKDATLSAAAHMLEQLGAELAVPVACERLKQPLVSGCEYLFSLLHRLKPACDEAITAAIENGLMTGDEDTAVAAATLADEIARPGADRFLSVLARGYDHWLKHEEPYPTKDGVIPHSPREKLLRAQLKIESPTVEALFDYARDVRSDVSQVARDAMVKALQESAEARADFVGAIVGVQPDSKLLGTVLNQNVRFSADEVERLCALLDATDPRLRFAALGLLSEAYLSKDRIERLATAKLADKEQDIRERAYRALERLSVP